MEIIATIDNEPEFNLDYLKWWDHEIKNCQDEKDLVEFEDFYHVKIWADENIQVLLKQRREELYTNPAERIRRGETLNQSEINHAILILANRNDIETKTISLIKL